MPNVPVWVVEDLPYGVIIGAVFLRRYGNIISFAAGRGFKLAPESPRVPFISSAGASYLTASERKAVSWHASVQPREAEVGPMATVNRATWEQFYTVKPLHGEGEPAEMAEPPAQPNAGSAG